MQYFETRIKNIILQKKKKENSNNSNDNIITSKLKYNIGTYRFKKNI